MKKANDFYGDCLEGFVGVAQRFGYANGGARGNEVLMKRAEQSVRELLKLRPLIQAFGNDPTMYYYQVNSYAFAIGVTLAMLQLNAPKKFTERDLIPMIVNDSETSPHELAFTTLQQFGMDIGIYNQLVQEIYAKFQELHQPYWSAKEPRDYTLAAFYASFMTGCSISIEKFYERRAQKQTASVAQPPKAASVAAAPAEATKEVPAPKKRPAKKPAAKKPATEPGEKPVARKPAARKRKEV